MDLDGGRPSNKASALTKKLLSWCPCPYLLDLDCVHFGPVCSKLSAERTFLLSHFKYQLYVVWFLMSVFWKGRYKYCIDMKVISVGLCLCTLTWQPCVRYVWTELTSSVSWICRPHLSVIIYTLKLRKFKGLVFQPMLLPSNGALNPVWGSS